jgi:hypothetical protein
MFRCSQTMAKPPFAKRPASNSEDFVFLNVPYDSSFAAPFLAYICRGRVFRELAKAFVRAYRQPSIEQMQILYKGLTSTMPRPLTDAAATDPFNARVSRGAVVFTTALAQTL